MQNLLMDESASKDFLVALFEEVLARPPFERFLLAEPYPVHRRHCAAGSFFSCNRITHVLQGSFELALGSRDSYSEQAISGGTTLVMKPYCVTVSNPGSRCRSFGMVCLPHFLRLLYFDSTGSGSLERARKCYFHISDTFRPSTANAIATLCTLDDATIGRFGPSLMVLVCTLVLQDLKDSHVQGFGKAHNLWFLLRDYLAEHPEEQPSRRDVARWFNITETYVSRLFSSFANCTFKEYVRRNNLTRARQLLATSQLTVDEVAYHSGFNNTSYFIRLFKERYHLSPGAWRQMACQRKGTE